MRPPKTKKPIWLIYGPEAKRHAMCVIHAMLCVLCVLF